ncbi:hypothetical protein Hypma_009636 [Hypsizygus marmoreus]|uniref:Uncharacterized protein n=1 Tax=Hypsizygus marmoreus TaxID=39966 RepID=A0A369JV26_HYPMA|nr:hypothetical protein Hypma_009636 [Hypsizygus marmoreus]
MTIFQPPDTSGAHLAYVATVVRICQLAPTIVTLYDHRAFISIARSPVRQSLILHFAVITLDREVTFHRTSLAESVPGRPESLFRKHVDDRSGYRYAVVNAWKLSLPLANVTPVGFIKPSSYEVHIESLSKLTADALPVPQSCRRQHLVHGIGMEYGCRDLVDAVTITAYIASMMIWFVLPPQWINFPQGFSVAATCVMGVRLILNLRKAYYLYSTGDLDLRSTNRHDLCERKYHPSSFRGLGPFAIYSSGKNLQRQLIPPTPSLATFMRLTCYVCRLIKFFKFNF